jgi:hypothetical protein
MQAVINDDTGVVEVAGTPPLWVPQAETLLPNAHEYIAFRRKYPRLGGAQSSAPVAAAIPFIASAHEHAETAPTITSKRVATNGAETIEFNVPSYGYIRAIWLDFEVTKGKAASGAEASEDAPFNIVENVTLLDTNGAPIFGPLTGFNTFLSNLYGGYVYKQDIRSLPTFKNINTSGEARVQMRIPIEISHHDGTGCIGNQNAAAPYRIRLTLAPNATFFKKEPEEPTKQEFIVRVVLEAWSLPNAVDALGRPQAQLPPNYGTVQYWSERNQSGIAAGNGTVPILRVGNLIRNIIFTLRETGPTGKRKDSLFPEQPIINWDARQLNNETLAYRENRSIEPIETAEARPTGVFAYTFNRSNQDRCGDDKPWLWLPTVEATRLELTGTFGAGINTANVLINDVAPAEVNPTQRYAVPSATGFHPNADVPSPNQI